MTRQKKIWLIAAATLVVYIVAGFALGAAFHLGGGRLWLLRLGLTAFGVLSAAIIVWFFRAPATAAPRDDLDAAFAGARERLTAARGRRASLNTMPAMLVLGPRDSAKTSAVVRSQLEPDLLAGDVFRGEAVAATAGANLWFAQDTLVVEPDGDIVTDAPRWRRFARHLRPRRLAAAVTGGTQAPRVAVVCVSCETFYRANGAEETTKLARVLRERLGELCQQFGIRLPVYVLFTKADTVPHFDAYVRNLTPEEARVPIGAALAPDDGPAGTYADRATPRLESAWTELHRSMAMARLALLPREGAAARRLDGYEFPRELRKIAPIGVEFLRELCRPAQLAVSPVLRGFWFTGVQAVVVPNVMGPAMAEPARAASANARSATGVFSGLQGAAAAPAQPAAPRERKTARWVALPRFFHDVVLADAPAFDLARGGTHLDYLRRALLAAGIVAVLALGTAFTASYAANRRLERDVREAARSFVALPSSDVDLPAMATLQRLDSLRGWVDSLRRWELDAPPLHMRWGLYAGSRIYPEARRAYFAGFDKVLFHATRSAMVTAMRALPDSARPEDQYEPNYNLLRAYLITTTHPGESTSDFMRPVLTSYWLNGRRADADRQQLAERQFDTYAEELRVANPYDGAADAAAVSRARLFLRQFAGSEHIYQSMLADASRGNPPIAFNRTVPGSAGVVPVTAEVPGAFTKGGWTFMQNALKNVDRFFARDAWVLGEESRVEGSDRARIAQELQTRYTTDYIDAWRRFLGAASVARFTSVRDAAQKLASLSSNQSPLLALFATASRETNVGSPAIATAFQAVQTIVPPDTKDKLIVEPNQPYVNALAALQASLDQVAGQRGPASEAAAGQAQSNAIGARTAAHQITAGFTLAADPQVNASVQRLLDAPVAMIEPLIRNIGALEINSRARLFCAALRPMLAKFPFDPAATQEATLGEVTSMLRPGTGTLWAFYNDALQTALPKQGTQYVPASGTVRLSSGFVTMFNRLAAFSDALFRADVTEIRQRWTVQPRIAEGTSNVTIAIDGQSARSTKNALETVAVTWPAGGRESKLTAQLGNTEYALAGPYTGTWGAFRLFYDADAWFPEGAGSRAEWALGTRAGRATAATGATLRISVEIDAGPMTPALRRGWLGAGGCPGDIAN